MGNSITKNYDACKDYTATAGHNRLFKLYPAVSRINTTLDVTIWGFDKTELSKRKNNPITDKTYLEQIYQIMKKDMILLRDISQASNGGTSNIIQLIEIIEDNSNMICFVTERVHCSLADLLTNFENIPLSIKLDEMKKNFTINNERGNIILTEIEISRGLVNIAEGLQFLHSVQRKIHCNISPENILLTPNGIWKLCGLGFALSYQSSMDSNIPSPYFLQQLTNSYSIRLEPDLRYCSPELTKGGLNLSSIRYVTSATDIFSIGIVFYETYRHSILSSSTASGVFNAIPMSNNNVTFHQTALENLNKISFEFFSSPLLSQMITKMIEYMPGNRSTLMEIINHQYYSTGPLAVLKIIDSLRNRDFGTQSSQLLILPNQLHNFPDRVLESSILPNVCQITMGNIQLLPFSFPIFQYTAKILPAAKFCTIVGPTILLGLNNNTSIEVMTILLKNLSFLIDIFDHAYLQNAIIQLLCNVLDKAKLPIQIHGFRVLCNERICRFIAQPNLVTKIVPRICREACKNSDPNVKINALYVLSLVSNRLEKNYLIQNIIPTLKYITDNDQNPLVAMCVLGNYDVITDILGVEYMARTMIPQIAPMLVDRRLDKKQFEIVCNLFKSVVMKVFDSRCHELSCNIVALLGTSNNSSNSTDLDPFYTVKLMIQDQQKNEENTQNNNKKPTEEFEITKVADEVTVPNRKLTKVRKIQSSGSSSPKASNSTNEVFSDDFTQSTATTTSTAPPLSASVLSNPVPPPPPISAAPQPLNSLQAGLESISLSPTNPHSNLARTSYNPFDSNQSIGTSYNPFESNHNSPQTGYPISSGYTDNPPPVSYNMPPNNSLNPNPYGNTSNYYGNAYSTAGTSNHNQQQMQMPSYYLPQATNAAFPGQQTSSTGDNAKKISSMDFLI